MRLYLQIYVLHFELLQRSRLHLKKKLQMQLIISPSDLGHERLLLCFLCHHVYLIHRVAIALMIEQIIFLQQSQKWDSQELNRKT